MLASISSGGYVMPKIGSKQRWWAFTSRERKIILERDNYICVYCGKRAQEVDHVIPIKRGGAGIPENGVACCRRCNNKKRSSMDEKWMMRGMIVAAVREAIHPVWETIKTRELVTILQESV